MVDLVQLSLSLGVLVSSAKYETSERTYHPLPVIVDL
jgi:hypothetical protein